MIHDLFGWVHTRINPKGIAIMSGELNRNAIHTRLSDADQVTQRKSPHISTINRGSNRFRQCKLESMLNQRWQQMPLKAFYEPSSLLRILRKSRHSTTAN